MSGSKRQVAAVWKDKTIRNRSVLTTSTWAAQTLRRDVPGADRQALHDTVGLEPTAGRD